MSQSGRFTTNQPVPGAGIQTITGMAGGPVPGDLAANVNIVGAGIINVVGVPGANTLTITSAGLPATYPTDNGVAVPDAFGNVNVEGGLNINTDALIANTITINLDDSIALAGTLDVHGYINTATGDIIATTGDIIAAAGNVQADVQVIGTGGGVFHDNVEITANGLTTTGPTILNDLNMGVVQVDNTHELFSTLGQDGQLLIGSNVGAPIWANIQPGRGIAVINTPNGIQLQGTAALPTLFNADIGGAVAVAGILRINGDANITTDAVGNQIGINLNHNVNLIGSLTAANLTANVGDIIANNGNISAILGNLNAVNGTMHSLNATIDGNTTLTGQLNGVLRTNGVGLVTASNGAVPGALGQVIISGGAQPLWRNLTAGANINIVNAANSITISAPVAGGFGYTAFKIGLTANMIAPASAAIFWLGEAQIMTDANIDGCFNGNPGPGSYITLGDGVGTPAIYTAPANGLYQFTIATVVSDATIATFNVLYFKFHVGGIDIGVTSNNPYLTHLQGSIYWLGSTTQTIYMNTGDTISASITVATGIPNRVTMYTNFVVGWPSTYFSGIRIA